MDWVVGGRKAVLISGLPELVCNRANANHLDAAQRDLNEICPLVAPENTEKDDDFLDSDDDDDSRITVH